MSEEVDALRIAAMLTAEAQAEPGRDCTAALRGDPDQLANPLLVDRFERVRLDEANSPPAAVIATRSSAWTSRQGVLPVSATRAYDQFVEVDAGDFPKAERLRDRELAVAELVLGRQDVHACPLSDELTIASSPRARRRRRRQSES